MLLRRLRRRLASLRYNAAARMGATAFILSLLQPSPVLVTVGPGQVVHTSRPLLGVHTRLTDEVEPWKIKRSLELVRAMGASWIVEFFPWAYYERNQGEFSWDHADLVVDFAVAQGLTVIARLGLVPGWARPENTPLTHLEPRAYQHFANFVGAFTERFDGRVEHIIVGNEPNLSYEWGYQASAPADYVALLRTVYPVAKRANPSVTVLAGALAPNLEPAGSPWAMNDLAYLQAMYEEGAAGVFDALAVHAYGLAFPPESEPGPALLNFRRVELVRKIMENNGDSLTPIFITESGWNDHPRWTMAVSPANRIRYTLDSLQHAERHWPYVSVVAIWAFRYPAPTGSYPDYFTLVTPEFVTKPVYQALREFTGN